MISKYICTVTTDPFSFRFQAKNDINNAHIPDLPSPGAGDFEFSADVNLHDVQCVAMLGCGDRCCHWLLLVRMEEIRYRRYY